MLSADMVMAQQTGLFDRIFNDFLHTRAEGNLPEGHRRPAARKIPFDFETNLLGRKPHFFQDHQGNAVALAQDGQDEMLGA